MLFKKLIRTAWKYKPQFLSMILMVAIGVGVFLGFNIEWKSIEADVGDFFEKTAYADFRVYSETGFTSAEIEAVRKIDGVKAATRYLSVTVGVKDTKKSVTLNVSESNNVSTFYLMEGKEYDEANDGIWLSDRFAKENDLSIGDKLTLTYRGALIEGEIVGLIKSGENMICVADENQLMPDFTTHGYAYVTPQKLKNALGDMEFYPQIHLLSDLGKAEMEEKVQAAVGRTVLVTDKTEHMVYAEAKGEEEEGKTMGSILPVLFLAIAILTMTTTMHRVATNEKVQIGTLKALGFKDRRILLHYTSYGLVIGLVGSAFGILLGYGIAALVMSPHGMMSTYFDLPAWWLVMPAFCVPVMLLTIAFLTLISYLSVRRMLRGTAAEALRPYQPKKMKKALIERVPLWEKLPFGTKWNTRDVLRHKSRSAMTLVGVIGCMILLVGGLGMKDTMAGFMDLLENKVSRYATRVNLTEAATNEEAIALAASLDGDWQASVSAQYRGEPISVEIYENPHELVCCLDEDNRTLRLPADGAYLCLRLSDTAKIGDTVSFSPYGSDEIYTVRVAGYYRSVLSKSIVMSRDYAEQIGIPYRIGSVYTNERAEAIPDSPIISGKQDKQNIIDSYNGFMQIMDTMVILLVVAAVVLGIVVLYNLGVMSYVERYRELATLKVLGFRDRQIGRLLISQNVYLTVIGVLIGLPTGYGVLKYLIWALASEYELTLMLGPLTYSVSILVTFGVSLLVGVLVARKNRKIDMVEALKGAE